MTAIMPIYTRALAASRGLRLSDKLMNFSHSMPVVSAVPDFTAPPGLFFYGPATP